jgi:hypothetical protein
MPLSLSFPLETIIAEGDSLTMIDSSNVAGYNWELPNLKHLEFIICKVLTIYESSSEIQFVDKILNGLID